MRLIQEDPALTSEHCDLKRPALLGRRRRRGSDARQKADAATAPQARSNHLAAEARWLSLARSYELQRRLSEMLGGKVQSHRVAFDPEVVATINFAFSAVFADLGLSDRDDAVALRVARRIIELAAAGERDPERLKATTLAWMPELA
jgi:ubiquitin